MLWVELLFLTACGPNPDSPASGAGTYHGLRLNTVTNEVVMLRTATPADGWTAVEKKTGLSGFEVLDPIGARADRLSVRRDQIVDWCAFKKLADTPKGPLALIQRYSPPYPAGNPWPELRFEAGESGVPINPDVVRDPMEAAYLLYAYDSRDLLAAIYNAKGDLRQISSHTGLRSSWWHANSSASSPYDAYAIPDRIKEEGGRKPPLTPALLGGLDQVRYSKAAPSALLSALWVRQYENGSVFRVVAWDPSGELRSDQMLRFGKRPFDPQVMQAQRSY